MVSSPNVSDFEGIRYYHPTHDFKATIIIRMNMDNLMSLVYFAQDGFYLCNQTKTIWQNAVEFYYHLRKF